MSLLRFTSKSRFTLWRSVLQGGGHTNNVARPTTASSYSIGGLNSFLQNTLTRETYKKEDDSKDDDDTEEDRKSESQTSYKQQQQQQRNKQTTTTKSPTGLDDYGAKWGVYRSDDYGNEYLIQECEDEMEANMLLQQLRPKETGHRTSFFVRRVD
eukprot:GEZU01023377.1.p2 GENE.GEZU01023377.1~~GEZU01023377.1.p2  ORF type:complete len:155 (-),score=33.21 GEZU01023377.1:696-1160(-)